VIARSLVWISAGALPSNNSGLVVYLRVLLFAKQYNLVPVWEGNRRSGVALAVHHELSDLSTYGLKGHRKGDEHPAHTVTRLVGYGTLYHCLYPNVIIMVYCVICSGCTSRDVSR